MNKKIEKVRENIRLTEGKIRELNEYLRTLRSKERQLCDEEILKRVKEMAGKGDAIEMLNSLGKGSLPEETKPVTVKEDTEDEE